ncbi:MAG: DUF4062 domain-containing protein [Myxococcota bacterium]
MASRKKRPIKYQKAIVFISSRNTYRLSDEPLSDVRRRLKARIEKELPFLDVLINEEWPARAEAPQEASIDAGRECDVFVGILVNHGGFTAKGGLTATHQEFSEAAQHTRAKMLVFAEKALKDNPDPKLNREYAELVKEWMSFDDGQVIAFFESGDQLISEVVAGLKRLTAECIIWHAQRFRQKVQSDTEAEWEFMTFTERHERIASTLEAQCRDGRIGIPGLHRNVELKPVDRARSSTEAGRYSLRFARRGVRLPVIVSICPDRFSYPDAVRFVGYPFRTAVDGWDEDTGPLHLVLVYRTVTDTQIRRHIGNPDIHVSKQDWGFFASDPERFIQLAYLVKCHDPQDVGQRIRDFLLWLDSYDQIDTLLDRSKTRGQILRARST